MALTFVGGFFNLVIPGSTGGDLVKAWYAARLSQGAGTRAVISVFVDRFLGLFALVVFAAFALFFLVEGESYRLARMTVAALLGAGVFGALVVFSRRVRRGTGLSWVLRRLPLQSIVSEVGRSVRLYRSHPGAMSIAFAISLFCQGGVAVVVWQLGHAIGLRDLDLGSCLAFVPLINLVSAIPLLPGGWGVGELAFAWFFGQVGVPATEAVALSVVFRLLFVAANLPGGVVWIFMRGHPTRELMEAELEAAAQAAKS